MAYIVWTIERLVKMFKKWQENEFDGIVVLDGNRGIGKSTLAYKLCSRFDDFKPERDIVFSRDDVINAFAKKRKGIIFADEVINVVYNRDFFAEDQKKLLKMINMYRDHCNILICCVPNFYDLDKQFRQLVKLRINVIKRKQAVLHSKNLSSFSTDKWDMKINESIEQTWLKSGISKPQYQRLTTFRGMIFYQKLSEAQEKLYKRIKDEKRVHLLENEKNNKPIDKWDKIYDDYKKGITNDEKLKVWCDVSGEKFHNALSNLRKRAKDEETTLTKIKQDLKLTKVLENSAVLNSIPKKEIENRFKVI